MAVISPFQPVGPYFHVMLRDEPRGVDTLARPETSGERVTIRGTIFDGAGTPMSDALIEIWQADAGGRYRHPADPRAGEADPAFWGYGRTASDEEGRFQFETIKPGPVPGPDGTTQAPHVLVSLLAPGVLTRCVTRLYFADEPGNARDPVLRLVPAHRRHTLLATPVATGRYEFPIHLQGPNETVFFDV